MLGAPALQQKKSEEEAPTKLATVCVVGLGYVGLPVAVEFGKRRPTVGFDLATRKVERLKQFNDATDKLPFDQHCVVAICAPRPVLFTNATDDQWADPPGQFEMLKAATPVYKLLGVDGLSVDTFPDENKLIDSRLGYWIRPGKHAMSPPDWEIYLKFADKWLK